MFYGQLEHQRCGYSCPLLGTSTFHDYEVSSEGKDLEDAGGGHNNYVLVASELI
jgi:hypothetical protein